MFTHHPPASSAAAGPASPIIQSAPSSASPTSLSSRLRTLSVLRSYTHRVTTLASSNSIGNNNNNNNNNSDQLSPSSPAAPPLSPSRHIWLQSSITRSASYTSTLVSPTAPTAPTTSPGARGSTSDESIVRSAGQPNPCATGSGHGARQLGPVAVAKLTPPPPCAESPAVPAPLAFSPLSADHLRVAAPRLSPDPGAHAMTRTAAPDHSIASPTQAAAAAAAAAATTNSHGPGGASVSAPTSSVSALSTTQAPSATLPSIRFTTYIDPRSQRPSLTFQATTRILPTGSEVIRVGRYSERDGHGDRINTGSDRVPSSSPVGFKSKVVSRRHCEFWFDSGKWYIKDVKSSSGTFLNHIRLSPPGTESKPYPIHDGDIVQLGIDFKGGEEMIFRCVKMRLELNRGWTSKPTNFNLASHKRLRNLVGSGSGSSSQDCSICLNSIAPCQSLFVAPCSHTWHYKCIRSLLTTPSYPYFQCPNCRASADLEAEVDDPDEDVENLNSDDVGADAEDKGKLPAPLSLTLHVDDPDSELSLAPALDPASLRPSPDTSAHTSIPEDAQDSPADSPARSDGGSPALDSETPPPDSSIGWTRSAPVTIYPHGSGGPNAAASNRGKRTPSPSRNPALVGTEGPITPRNDAGPWVFDGSAGRRLLMGGTGPGPGAELNSASIDHTIDDDEQ